MENDFTGNELLRIWEAGKEQGLTQRSLAKMLGVGFNSLHGKLFRAQQQQLTKESTSMEPVKYPPIGLRAAVFDIECTNLKAAGVRDHLICLSVLPLDQAEPYTVKLAFEDLRNDVRVLKESCEALEDFEILIGHNISAFDMNWINSRRLFHGMAPMQKQFLYYDTYQAARRMAIKADRKSLAFLCDYFQVDFVKTSIYPVSWGRIDSPNQEEFEEALADIVYHCEEDVKANRELFYALFPRDGRMNNLPIKRW